MSPRRWCIMHVRTYVNGSCLCAGLQVDYRNGIRGGRGGGVWFVRAVCGTQSMPHSHYWEITQNFNILIITSTSTTTAVVAMVTMCVRIGSCTRRSAVIQQRTYNCEFHFHCCVMIHGPMLHTYLLSVLHWRSHSSTLPDQNRPHCFCSPQAFA